jgi:hypothetical protein
MHCHRNANIESAPQMLERPAEERRDFDSRDFWIWSRADSLCYFLAGGGIAAEFEALWGSATRGAERFETAIAERTYAQSGASLNYLIAGRKTGESAA